ncbi:hypothetical protein PybrP1_005852 [[Pythium] brassicae (nom. inval.)]|nr:hypothetical protein PybrP1_005852 [[Pythium] brassicae (nom. inval.)]
MTSLSPNSASAAAAAIASPWTKDHTYIIEATRRAHASCKSCAAKIELGRLRVGVVFQHMNGFVCINWHHIECYPNVRAIPLPNLEGFGELEAHQQQLVRSFMLASSSPVAVAAAAVSPAVAGACFLPEARTCSA